MHAKLINGYLQKPNSNVRLPDGRTATNPNQEILESLGFKEVLYVDQPYPEEGFYFTSSFQEQADRIIQVWTKIQIPEQPEPPVEPETPNEDLVSALKILTGAE